MYQRDVSYLLFDHHFVNSYTRDNEVGVGLGNMIPKTHLVGTSLSRNPDGRLVMEG